MPKCAIAECGATNKSLNKDSEPLKFHRFPTTRWLREKWILAAGRAPNWRPRKYNYVCSRHFKIEDYDSSGWRLLDATEPSLNLPSTARSKSSVDETLKDGVETVVVKVESDELTVEEDDPLEQLEKKRQREGEATQTETKKPRFENVNVIPTMMENDVPSTSCHKTNAMVPDIFMKKMLRTQNEIIDTLKTQVLMQNPDQKLLTFLRFLGAKMQKLSEERKKELQDIITKMLFEEHDAQ